MHYNLCRDISKKKKKYRQKKHINVDACACR